MSEDYSLNNSIGTSLGAFGLGGKPVLHHASLRYPNPFLDIASLYLPRTIKEMFSLCRYYYRTSPIINPIIRALARYPVTEILVSEIDPDIKGYWDNYINNQLNLRSFSIATRLDKSVYGNAFAYIHLPIQKLLTCTNCKKQTRIEELHGYYRFRGLNYELSCKSCGVTNQLAKVEDVVRKSEKEIKLIRLNPELIDIEVCPLTGHTDYFYTLPRYLRNEITIGKRNIIERLPDIFIESLRKQRRLKLSDGKVYHFKRESISEQDTIGWGEPLIQPVLKSSYYTQILRKAQEAVMQSAIVPLRFVFPQAGDSTSSPYTNANLLRWTGTIKTELAKWRRDPNHVGIVPLPVGNQVVGADGKALTLYQELDMQGNEICNGMGVPLEFYKGGLSWSGSNMSLRLMQQDFINDRIELHNFCQDFVLGNIANFLGKTKPKIEFAKFKMADDLQRSALENQLYSQQLLSGETLLEGMEHDFVKEKERVAKERKDLTISQKSSMLTQAQIQGQASVIQAKYQVQAQKAQMVANVQPQVQSGQQGQQQQGQPQEQDPMTQMQSQVQDQGIGADVGAIAGQALGVINEMDPNMQQTALNDLKMGNPELYTAVIGLKNSQQGSQENLLNKSLASVKPPRSPTPVG